MPRNQRSRSSVIVGHDPPKSAVTLGRNTQSFTESLLLRGFGLALLSIPPASHAGGLLLYEVGTADVGLASAGYSARAQDASTVFTNPAGMTRL